jgi:hypothetical protein
VDEGKSGRRDYQRFARSLGKWTSRNSTIGASLEQSEVQFWEETRSQVVVRVFPTPVRCREKTNANWNADSRNSINLLFSIYKAKLERSDLVP